MNLNVGVVSLIVLVLVLAEFAESQQSNLECDAANGWINLKGDRCYKLYYKDDARTWQRAEEICKNYGSSLVSIRDQYENNAIGKWVETIATANTSFWIGMSKIQTDACSGCTELKWSNGRTVTNNEGYWSDDQPNDDKGDCVYAEKNIVEYVYDRPYTWSYDNCIRRRAFVCERGAAPPGSFHCMSGGYVRFSDQCNNQCDCNGCSDELNCPNACKYLHRGISGTLASFVYRNSQSCTWAIESPEGTNVVIEFTNFNTEPQADFVTVYAGSVIETKATRVARLSGSLTSQTYRSYNNMMLVKFSSDSTQTSTGFQATWNSVTTGTAPVSDLTARETTQSYSINELGLTNTQAFLGMTDYVLVIKTEQAFGIQVITLEITNMDIHDSDYILFYDGKSPYSSLLAKMCNIGCDNNKIVFSTGREMSVYLRTDRDISKSVNFSFRYSQGCHVETSDKWGTLFSPGYPGMINYPSSVECTWRINSPQPIALYFDSDITLVDNSFGRINNGDYLEIYDNDTRLHPIDRGFNTEELRAKTIEVSTGIVMLRFATSSTRTARGFKATWSIGCPNPQFDSFTVVSQTVAYHYTATMTLTCALGYAFHQEQVVGGISSVSLECGFMGLWKNYQQIPRCTPVYCGTVPPIDNGYIAYSTGPTYSQIASYQCYPGSTLQTAAGNNNNNITCQSNGAWGNPPSCITAQCNPSQIILTIARGEGKLAFGDGFQIGSIINFTCDAGFEFDGEPIVFCQPNGSWTQFAPSCKRLTCQLPVINKGTFQVSTGTKFINYESSANFVCESGYSSIITSVTCQANRTLTELPVCNNIDECTSGITKCFGGGTCIDLDGTFKCTCPSGYKLKADGVTCEDLNECDSNNGNCDGTCTNSVGSYTCSCTPPYVLYKYNGFSGYPIKNNEDGTLPTDTYHIGHSCVLIECNLTTEMSSISNGMLLTKRVHHHYGDLIEYRCNIGFQDLTYPEPLLCDTNGAWTGRVPTCTAAQCEMDNLQVLQNSALFNNGPYPYLHTLYLNCTKADTPFTWYRHCTYNRQTNKYELQGSPYECGRVSCGQPKPYPGTNYSPLQTFYNSQFNFVCSTGNVPTGKSLKNDTVVRCGADGLWDFGNLQCFGQACVDPGYPAGGYLNATSFSDKSQVTFGCTKPGYSLSNPNPLTCIGTQWQGTVPTCVDTQKPVFSSSCQGTITRTLRKYEKLSAQLPSFTVTDNTGVVSLTVTPPNANTTLYVNAPTTVIFTASDYAGNFETCVVSVLIYDETPPTVTCPQLIEVTLTDNTPVNRTIADNLFSTNDNSGQIQSLEIQNRPKESFSAVDLYNTFTYTALVRDSNNNVGTCSAQVFIKPAVCSELSYPTPLNAQKTCTPISGGLSCEMTCDDGYTFTDDNGKTRTISCTTGIGINNNKWIPDLIPACVIDTIAPDITCPSDRTIYLTESSDNVTVDFSTLPMTRSDLNLIRNTVFSHTTKVFTVADLYKTLEVTVTVTDYAGQSASCKFQYLVLPSLCSPLSLPVPINGLENQCTRRTNSQPFGYDCTINCQNSYVLRGVGLTKSVSCNDNNHWNDVDVYPACIKDTTPPTLTCSPSTPVFLKDENDNRTIVFANDPDYQPSASDIGGLGQRLFSPASLFVNKNDINQPRRTIVLTQADLAGNVAQCTFYITVFASICSPLTLPTPLNGAKTCTQSGSSWVCDVTCNTGYAFSDTLQASITTSCNSGSGFNTYIPACTNKNAFVAKEFTGTLQYFYTPVNGAIETVPNSCIAHYANQQTLYKIGFMATELEDLCRSVFIGSTKPDSDRPDITFNPEAITGAVNIDSNSFNRLVSLKYVYIMIYPDSNLITSCANNFATTIADAQNIFHLTQNIAGNGNECPELEWTHLASQSSTGKSCKIPYYSSLINNDQCLVCPAGTESDTNVCNICPLGTYRVESSLGGCQSCPTSYTTRYPGSTSPNDCITPCPNGEVSASGYAPCYPCKKGTYSSSLQVCTLCPGSTTTVNTGTGSDSGCVPQTTVVTPEPCSIGTQTSSTPGVCELCPEGTYRSDASQPSCQSCLPTVTTTTYIKGAISVSSCYDKCLGGMYSNEGRAPCKACPTGTYYYNSTYCQPCASGFTTKFVGSQNSQDCQPTTNFRVKCPRGTYRSTVDSCTKCPIGTYSNVEDPTQCTPCGNQLSTYFEGASSFAMCFQMCSNGFYSLTGLSPCTRCGIGKYWKNSTNCEICPSGGTTATDTAASVAQCINVCPAGQFSYGGYNRDNVCRQCPPNHYQDQTKSTLCNLCNENSEYSTAGGLTSASQCQDANAGYCTSGRCGLNGVCNIAYNFYQCQCPQGYYGPTCNFQVNYCSSNPCYNGGQCTSTASGHACNCQGTGATGDNCEIISMTCDTSDVSPTCKNGGHCINKPGSFDCLCSGGFSGSQCLDQTNICITEPCNSIGSSGCVDISKGANLRRKCNCSPGFEGVNCEINTDACASNPCINGGQCMDGNQNNFQCICQDGYNGLYCENRFSKCNGKFCGSGGMCVDDQNDDKAQCLCPEGYTYGVYTQYKIQLSMAPTNLPQGISTNRTVHQCRAACTSSQSCVQFTYEAQSSKCYLWNTDTTLTLTNGHNTYDKVVIRPDDDFWTERYSVNAPSNSNSNKDSETVAELNNDVYGLNVCGGTEPLDAWCCPKGQQCERFNPPAGIQCLPTEFRCTLTNCQDYDVRFKCAAHRVFLDNICTLKTDYCSSNPCLNNGFCISVTAGYQCNCQQGYSGFNCQTNIDDCASILCNGGTCVDQVNGYECNCTEGFTGQSCVTPVNYCGLNAVTCNGHGTCENKATDYMCNCYPGYEGKDCENEVDKCLSKPCLQGSNCVKQFDNYQCVCLPGWTGKNCDVIVDHCAVSQCLADCQYIFNDYYCHCEANTYGRNCENKPNACGNYNKCLNGGSCSLNGSDMQCSCPTKYKGDGCQILIDHCGLTNNCQNGAKCINTISGYECQCMPGYQGYNCESEINECLNVNCPGGGTCYDDIGRYYCRCPLKMTGTGCAREFDRNYDLFFNHPQGYGLAWIPYFIEVTNVNYMSLSLWVRFSQVNGEGVYLTQFIGDKLSESQKFMEFTEMGVKIYLDNNDMSLEYTRNAKLNDGNWNLVNFNLNMVTGEATLFLNTVKHVTKQNEDLKMPNSTFKMWVVLGCEFDQQSEKCTGDNSFNGYLSQINWYRRELTFLDNIPYLFKNPQHIFDSPISDVVLVWNEYQLESGVNRMIPSEAKGDICSDINRNPPCSLFQVTSRPVVSGCPADIVMYSPNRTVSISWKEPTFSNLGSGNKVIYPDQLPGSTFTWGVSHILYIGEDAVNNQVFCSFKVFVQKSNCTNPPNPFGGRQELDDISPPGRKGSMISCFNQQNTNYIIDRKHPEIFTCDQSGSWNVDKYWKNFRYPSCGKIVATPRVSVYIRLVYRISTEACRNVKIELNARLETVFQHLKGNYSNQLCIPNDCSAVEKTITCGPTTGRRKRQIATNTTALVDINFPIADPTTLFDGETLTIEEFFTYFTLGLDVFNFNNTIPHGSINPSLYFIDVTLICPVGEVIKDGMCVECGPGNYYRNVTVSGITTAICDDCPLGQYQDVYKQTTCTPCQGGFTTEMTGSYESSQCKQSCPIGQYYDTNSCVKCPIGFYQDEVGQFYCKPCGAGYTTEFIGTNSSLRCSATCASGYQLDGNGNCVKCPIGQYRDATQTQSCQQCVVGYITAAEGSLSAAACTIIACNAGSKRNVTTNQCELCPIGYYQEIKWQTDCISCGDHTRYRTENTGSTLSTDCLYYCPSGFEVESVGSCKICPVGFYKDNSVNIQGMCQLCGNNKRTPNEGSGTELNCTIYKCPVGQKPNTGNTGCEVCPLGTYQDIPYSTECKNCPAGLSTRNTTSNSSSDCESYCPSGQEKLAGGCVPCPNGFYKNNVDMGLFSPCSMCPSLYTTETTGSQFMGNCSIRTCPRGTKRTADDTGCDPCPLGQYQPEPYQLSCLNCDPMTSTRQINSINKTQCEAYCPSGSMMTSSGCQQCAIGYYKDNNDGGGVFQECQLCPVQNITSSTGSVSVGSCTVANCSAGFRRVSNVCEACPFGTYQPQKWQTTCINCGTDKTTEKQASTSESECILVCPPGKEDIGGSCQLCKRGYYKTTNAAALCTECDAGTTTTGIGSTAKSMCSLPACLAGNYLDMNSPNAPVCKACPYDQYQDNVWQEACKNCPSNTVTLQTGSSSSSMCVVNCSSGSEYDANNHGCNICPIGYYRNNLIRNQTHCVMCDIRYITLNQGAQDVSQCNIINCTTPGTYRNTATNTCDECPIGQYNSINWRSSCQACPTGQSTRSTGSTSDADCRPTCPIGNYVGTNNQCQLCPKGTYRSSMSQDNCTVCQRGLTTPGMGADSPDDCSVSPCVAGQYYILQTETCQKCAIGRYQQMAGQFQCIDCPFEIKFTPREGAVDVSECRSTCGAGEQLNNATLQCEKCAVGYYQPQAFEFKCMACPDGRKYTSGTGSTSINSCLAFCNTGAANTCSVNATCRDTSNSYECACFTNHDDVGTTTGSECVHKCDRGFCKNSGICTRDVVSCACSEFYSGDRCETRVNAESLASDTLPIVIPVAIGVGGLILFLILLAVCCLCWFNKRKQKKRPAQYSEFHGNQIDKHSVHSYEFGQNPMYSGPQRLMLAPHSEMVYDNMAYNQDFDGKSLDTAVYQA